jgi:hypothetical protein
LRRLFFKVLKSGVKPGSILRFQAVKVFICKPLFLGGLSLIIQIYPLQAALASRIIRRGLPGLLCFYQLF